MFTPVYLPRPAVHIGATVRSTRTGRKGFVLAQEPYFVGNEFRCWTYEVWFVAALETVRIGPAAFEVLCNADTIEQNVIDMKAQGVDPTQHGLALVNNVDITDPDCDDDWNLVLLPMRGMPSQMRQAILEAWNNNLFIEMQLPAREARNNGSDSYHFVDGLPHMEELRDAVQAENQSPN